MRDKRKSLINVLKKNNTKKVKVCTQKFCATGYLIEEYNDDDLVCLEDVYLEYGNGEKAPVKKENICICDDHIIAFTAITED